jgi:uncharacterized protein
MTDLNHSHTGANEEEELVTVLGHWSFDYTYFAGSHASRFFRELSHKRIMGTRCPQCQRLLVPARAFCASCFCRTGDWEAVGMEGNIDTFTITVQNFPGLPEPPLVLAYVTLDGADTALINFVKGVDLSDIESAAGKLLESPRVRVVFGSKPEGKVTDFCFELIPDST